MKYSPRDIEITARTVYGEARGELEAGMIAVAWVIRNRAEKGGWWGDTPEKACLMPWQFSCWNKADPNLEKIKAVDLDSDVFRQCLIATAAVFADLVPDPTGGACHYHVEGISPPWAKDRIPDVTIGNHLFYRGIA